MSNRSLAALGAIVALLLGGYIVYRATRKPPVPKKPPTMLGEVRQEDIHKVRIFAAGREAEAIELVRESADLWRVPSRYNHRVNATELTTLFTNLTTMRAEVRGHSRESHDNFGVDDAHAVHLILYGEAGDERSHLLLGKQGADYDSSFVRRQGDDTVFLVTKNLRSHLGMSGDEATPDAKRFIDLQITSFDSTRVTEVTMDGPARHLRFERYEESPPPPPEEEPPPDAPPPPPAQKRWRLAEPQLTYELNESTLTSWLSSLSAPRAEDVLDPSGDYGLDNPPWRIVLKLEGDRTIEVRLGREREGEKRPVQIVGEPGVFLAGKWTIPLRRMWDFVRIPSTEIGQWRIQRIELLDPNKEVSVAQGDDGFDALANKWTRLEGYDLVQGVEEAAMGFASPSYRLRLHTEQGVKEIIAGDAVPERGGSRYVKWSEADQPWVVEKSWLEQRFPAWGTIVTTLRTPVIDRAKVEHVHVTQGGIVAEFDVASRLVGVLGYSFAPKGTWEEAVWKAAEGFAVHDLAPRAAVGDAQVTIQYEGEASGTIQIHAAEPEGGGRFLRSGDSVWLVRNENFDAWFGRPGDGWILRLPGFAGTTKVTKGDAVLEGVPATTYADALLIAEAVDLTAEEIEWTEHVVLETAEGAKLEIDVGAEREGKVPVRLTGAQGVLWYAAGALPAWPSE